MPPKPKRPLKPTVFLSHSSSNRRELLALKRLLDERAGGMIDFFLSSDDDSIAHGTIWPEEVRAALDRMSHMLIFVSTEALKTGWTYFEAGYGFCKLSKANVYCLPGTDKASLPSPFNIIQNRNLHSPRDLTLLIKQLNEAIDGRMDESVSKNVYEKVFKKPLLGEVEIVPKFDQIVKSITVEAIGPDDSTSVFAKVCEDNGYPISLHGDALAQFLKDQIFSIGVSITAHGFSENPLLSEIKITEEMEKNGRGEFIESYHNKLQFFNLNSRLGGKPVTLTLEEINKKNVEIQNANLEIKRNNSEKNLSRKCTFAISLVNYSLSASIVDLWIEAVKPRSPIEVKIHLAYGVIVENRIEEVSARVHGTQLLFGKNASLIWKLVNSITLEVGTIKVVSHSKKINSLKEFEIEELISVLYTLNLIRLPSPKKTMRTKKSIA